MTEVYKVGEIQVLKGPGLTVTTEYVKTRRGVYKLDQISKPSLDLKPQKRRSPHPLAFGTGCTILILGWAFNALLGIGIGATLIIASFFHQRTDIYSFVSANIGQNRIDLYRAAREKDGELAYLAINEAIRLKKAGVGTKTNQTEEMQDQI